MQTSSHLRRPDNDRPASPPTASSLLSSRSVPNNLSSPQRNHTEMSASTAYLLQVLWAEVNNPPDLDPKKAPSLRVRIHHPDIPNDLHTDRIARTYKPVWNTTFPSLNVADPSVKLTFTMDHKSSLLSHKISIGASEIQINQLLDLCEHASNDLKAPDDIKSPLQVKLAKVTSSLTVHTLLETVNHITQGVQAIGQSSPGFQRAGQVIDVVDASGALDKALESLGKKLESIHGIIQAVDELAKIYPYVDAAWQVLSSFYKVVKAQKDTDQQVVLLVHTMDDTVKSIQEIGLLQNKHAYFQDTLLGIMKQILECVFFVQGYISHGFSGRMLRQLNNDKSVISQMIENFKALKQSLQTSIVIDITLVSLRMSSKIEVLYLKNLLSPYEMDWSDRPQCHPDTRKDMLTSIRRLLTNPLNDQKIV
ncbi:hypothetical protein B0H21DRAFT_452114 [Amylocystis lapponica]|nr:hypothetical protein B0H21DRAFT_452114 [Amylocystis lapponica]